MQGLTKDTYKQEYTEDTLMQTHTDNFYIQARTKKLTCMQAQTENTTIQISFLGLFSARPVLAIPAMLILFQNS